MFKALWWVNGDLLQVGLWPAQVYCTQSPCCCSSPLLTCSSSGDTQTQLCLSLFWVSGSWCAQGTFELSKHTWWVFGLILSMISALLPSFGGFCFILWHEESSLSCSNARQLPLQTPTVLQGLLGPCLLTVTPALCSHHSDTAQLPLQKDRSWREFWQNVGHWRREWQATSVFLPWESQQEYEKAKRKNTERWISQASRCLICY